jgi:hypothetical protein
MERGFSSIVKKGGDMKAAGDDFIPYMTTFFKHWEGDREAAEVARSFDWDQNRREEAERKRSVGVGRMAFTVRG